MVEMQADERNELTSAQAGDIIAVVGMKNVQTGQLHSMWSEARMYSWANDLSQLQ